MQTVWKVVALSGGNMRSTTAGGNLHLSYELGKKTIAPEKTMGILAFATLSAANDFAASHNVVLECVAGDTRIAERVLKPGAIEEYARAPESWMGHTCIAPRGTVACDWVLPLYKAAGARHVIAQPRFGDFSRGAGMKYFCVVSGDLLRMTDYAKAVCRMASARQALYMSALKWLYLMRYAEGGKRLLEGSVDTCALCQLHTGSGCMFGDKKCPVFAHTGKPHCADTPYARYRRTTDSEGARDAAGEMFMFLLDLYMRDAQEESLKTVQGTGPCTMAYLCWKDAKSIAAASLRNDDYHNTIQAAARFLVLKDMGHYTYITNNSGATLWDDGKGRRFWVKEMRRWESLGDWFDTYLADSNVPDKVADMALENVNNMTDEEFTEFFHEELEEWGYYDATTFTVY